MTDYVLSVIDRRLVRSPVTPEIRKMLADDYDVSTPPHEQERIDELGLVVFHGGALIFGIVFLGVAAALGAAAHSHGTYAIARVLISAVVAWCCIGLGLHLTRYYVATWRTYRDRKSATGDAVRRPGKWPAASSDNDFLVQTLLALTTAVMVIRWG